MDYKNTLNLPRTDFAMKADLVTREPLRLDKWEKENLYAKIQATRADAPKFILHDGPPFANGDVHIGTALNKILKDIIIKYKTLRGFSVPYVPGWDCHGLPIEFKVSQDMRKAGDTSADPATIRKACDAYARKYIDLQRTQFKRLGVLGDWDHPYLTLNKDYEADELRLFADIVEQGFVYRGKKPVYWSIPCRTALAEAEVEYADHVSQSVFVKFPVIGRPGVNIVIWTTTPWTLPANLAVAYNSTFSYSLVQVGEEQFIVSAMLLSTVAAKCGWPDYQIVRSLDGEHLKSLEYQHPFCNRTGKLFAGDNFVTNDTGSGFVHIAPGHGLDDYNVGRQNGLPIYSPVNDDGAFAHSNELPVAQQMPAEMLGKSILEKHGKSDANEAVLHELRVRHALLHQENYHHSYPHCWRSKTPVIFRAMDQWFIKIDHVVGTSCRSSQTAEAAQQRGPTFREQALSEIDRVAWIPDWGVNRIKGAVQSRPDWCISRQRTWGVPIPAFYDAKGEPILDAQIVRNAADLIEQHGSNVWFEKSVTELWSLLKPKDWRGAEAAAKSNDTLDVWIDSGSSSRCVLMRRSELRHNEAAQRYAVASGTVEHVAHFEAEKINLTRIQIDDAVIAAVPRHIAKKYRVVPVYKHGHSLTVAVADPSDLNTIDSLTHLLKLEINLQVASEIEIEIALAKYYGGGMEDVRNVADNAFWQADMYLEGSDQHRGWFQSSLLLSLAGNGAAPFKTVLTHGFMVDADREKISKSKQGGYEKPQTADAYVKKYGADVVRLWVASQDFRNDIIVSEERVNKVGETYRGIRNALRYQLSNLYDFDPAQHNVPDDQLTGLDRWILGEFSKLEAEVIEAYDKYEFHVVYQKVSQFIAVELSSIYHDVIKDRLYTDPANSPRRRSTQTALHRLATGLCQMLAPILAFTADEAWEFVPGETVNSVHEAHWLETKFLFSENEKQKWIKLLKLRGFVLASLEVAREQKEIGKSLEAKVVLAGQIDDFHAAAENLETFRELANVSQLKIEAKFPVVDADGEIPKGVGLGSAHVSKADGQKCERCWHWETDIGQNAEHPTICGRCVEAVAPFGKT